MPTLTRPLIEHDERDVGREAETFHVPNETLTRYGLPKVYPQSTAKPALYESLILVTLDT
jgi:hypothetical protein